MNFSDMEKSAAVQELCSEGYLFEDAVSMVKEATSNHMIRAMTLGSGFQEAAIAKDHGKKVDPGIISRHLINNSKINIDSLKDGLKTGAKSGIAGLAIGSALGAISSKKYGVKGKDVFRAAGQIGGLTGLIGANAGLISGAVKSSYRGYKANGEKLNKHYSEKKAAYDSLMSQGFDFDTAVNLISKVSQD